MQKAFSMDKTTIEKIGKGLLISLGGACLAGFILLIPEVNDFITSNDPVDYRPALLALWGAASTSVINICREFVAGDKV